MHVRRLFALDFPVVLRLFLFWALTWSATGCAVSPHAAGQGNSPATSRPPSDVAPPSTRPDGMDASTISPAALLARQAESYSQQMEPAIAKRAAAPVAPSQPSLVQWGETNDTHLSLLPGYLLRPDGPAPTPVPVEASVSSANPPTAQLASMKSGAIPNSGAVVSAESPVRESPPTDRAKTQIASISPVAGGSEMTQDGAPDAAGVAASGSAETLGALSTRLAKRVRDYPHDVSAHFDYQLSQFLMDQPVPDLSTISSLPDEDREMISAVMDGLSNYRNNLRADNNMLLSHKVRPLLEMADRLRSLADLTIPTLALCREVRGYGNYEPFGDPPHFNAGVEHPAILYCEVQNFSSQIGDNKMWQTQLVQDAVLYTEGGMSVWNDKTQAVNDSARNRRQDFFIVQKMTLPSTLPVGRYLLKVTIEDKQSHHVAEATQPLLIVAQ